MSGNKEITAFPEGDNMFEWAATVKGPGGSPYEGMTFKLKLKFPADYPFTSPGVTFTTPVYHPNVDSAGNICLDILKDKWTAAYSVSTVLLSLQALLQDANVTSPLNTPAAQMWPDAKAFRVAALKRYTEAGLTLT
jgi:ubiquitin-conjugating enzyme E2 C